MGARLHDQTSAEIMTAISIKAMVDDWVAANPKVWEHDRSSTLGASETGTCSRRAYFSKAHPELADTALDGYGFKIRGDLIENHLWLPAIQHAVRGSNSLQLLYSGESQRTISSGFISASPDGLLTGLDRDCLAHHGVPDIGESGELIVECKSCDPRLKLLEPKPEHVFQVQVQMGLIREVTAHRPEYALISYINASDCEDIKEWPIRFDASVYAVARTRARQVFSAETAADLPPEGRLEGGRECKVCSYAGACGAIEADAVPVGDFKDDLPAVVIGKLNELVMQQAAWKREKREAERNLALSCDAIKQVLREAATRTAAGRGWSVSYSRTRGRKQLDTKALIAAAIEAGIDVTKFEKAGADADRLTVRTLGGDGDDDDDE
jgi:hypothetical protein